MTKLTINTINTINYNKLEVSGRIVESVDNQIWQELEYKAS